MMPEIKMIDYMVSYQNHPTFKNSKKSPVRFFTTIDRNKFVLSPPLYENCKECKRYVTVENRHCSVCKNCPSRDGLAVKHCGLCSRCVPEKYQHCKKCNTCSFKNRCHSNSKDGKD
uniref:TNFR-Cys domain-containing protein n=1 Tax=Panagrolaimus superbus TaxID=310955 RepID=A0A914YJT4_9BILA